MEMTVDRLIEDNLGLVGYTINKFFNQSYTRHNPLYNDEDLVQIGSLGLIKAAKSYDPNLGQFSTYAVTAIKNAICSAFEYQSNHEATDDFSTRVSYDTLSNVAAVQNETENLDCYDLICELTKNMSEREQKKATLLLSYISMGYKVNEAARKIGLTAGRAYSYIHRIKKAGIPNV